MKKVIGRFSGFFLVINILRLKIDIIRLEMKIFIN